MATDSRGYASGIVIGEETIAIVEMNLQRGRTEITARGATETPPGAVDGTAILDPARVAQAIRGLRREMGSKSTLATVAINHPGYSLRTVRVPEVPLREQRLLVRGELEQVGALPVGTGGFGFVWMPAPAVEGRKMADAAAYYASDAQVDAVRSVMKQAGLQLAGMEPASLAMMRASVSSREERRPMALLYVSNKHSDLVIYDGAAIRHVRRIPAGWDEAEGHDAPVGPLNMTVEAGAPPESYSTPAPFDLGEESERESRSRQAPAFPRPAPRMDPSIITTGGGNGVAAPAVPFLAAEVARSLAFYAREYSAAPQPELLMVMGLHHGTRQVRETLASYLAIPVDEGEIIDLYPMPPAAGPSGAGEDAATWLAALGAAFSDVEATIPTIDISMQEQTAVARRRAPTVLLAGMATSTVWMLAAVVGSLMLTYMESGATQEVGRLESEIKRVNDELAPKLRTQAIVEAAQSAANRSRVPASSILGRIAATNTPGVIVTSVKATPDGKVAIEGTATDSLSMEAFSRRLSEGKSIQNTYFENFKKDPKLGITFRIVGFYRTSVTEEKPKKK